MSGGSRTRILLSAPMVTMALVTPAIAHSQKTPDWPDTIPGRLEILALLQSFNAELLSHDSATLTLDTWCQRHHLGPPGAKIIAERVIGEDKPATTKQRSLLHVAAEEAVRYRRVRLRCGALVLSEADNWYVPGRLTPAMNTALDTSDTSFGRVVQPLRFRRQTLLAQLLWSPLPDGWDIGAPIPKGTNGTIPIPAVVIEHRAVLTMPDGTPFSTLVERYTNGLLAFPPPELR